MLPTKQHYARAEEDLMNAVAEGSDETLSPTTQAAPENSTETVAAAVASMEPNVPSLLFDEDEGNDLWRTRLPMRKRFMRKQLLATVINLADSYIGGALQQACFLSGLSSCFVEVFASRNVS